MKGSMQLFSVDQQRSQALEAHAASFASFKVRPSFLFLSLPLLSFLFLASTYESCGLIFALDVHCIRET